MKKFFGILLIVVGLITLAKVITPNGAETIGGLIGVSLFTFLPAYFLLRTKKTENTEKEGEGENNNVNSFAMLNISRANNFYEIVEKGVELINNDFKTLSDKGLGEAFLFCSTFLIDFDTKQSYDKDIDLIESKFSSNYKDYFENKKMNIREFIDYRVFFYKDEFKQIRNSTYNTPMFIYNAFYMNPFTKEPDSLTEFNESPTILFEFQAILFQTVSMLDKLKNK